MSESPEITLEQSESESENTGVKTETETKPNQLKECEFCCEMIPAKATTCKFCHSRLSKKTTDDKDTFSIVREEADHPCSPFKQKIERVTLLIQDKNLKTFLRGFLKSPSLYEDVPKLSADELFTILPDLRLLGPAGHDYRRQEAFGYEIKSSDPLDELLEFLNKEYAEQTKMLEELKEQGLCMFDGLKYLFTGYKKFFATIDGSIVGATIIDTFYERSMVSTRFIVLGETVRSNGESFFLHQQLFVIPSFQGAKKIEDLPLRPIDEATMKFLVERGKKFNHLGINVHFMNYRGPMFFKTQQGTISWKSDGRLMLDGVNFNKWNPGYTQFTDTNPYSSLQENPTFQQHLNRGFNLSQDQMGKFKGMVEVPTNELFRTWHTVGGFSLRAKKWGEILVENCTEIQFDDLSFSRLVLPPARKNLIHSLVTFNNSSPNCFTDIVGGGKGAGCIFLLHGPPGTGKTLTAEATAELLHRPLYSISVGELGVDTRDLDEALNKILEIASVWDAVILIDEADIFLERRRDDDIQRNALVGIFLRLLEYHQGIIFLTTNRVQQFDEAFHSRISIALRYPELDREGRSQVWKNLLDAAKISDSSVLEHVDELSEFPINGRQIRTTIRLAQSLAASEKKPLRLDHLRECISIYIQFQQDLIDIGNEASGLKNITKNSNGVQNGTSH